MKSNTMRYAHIFLVTGADPQLVKDYHTLGDFVRTLNDSLLAWDWYFRLHPCQSEEEAAARLAEAVAEAEDPTKQLYLFIFHKNTAAAAQTALREAIARLRGGEKLNILVFFRGKEDATRCEALNRFKEELTTIYLHYPSLYEDVDSIKLRLIASLGCLGLSYLPLTCQNGQITLGGDALLSTQNLPMFTKNEELRRLERCIAEQNHICREKERELDRLNEAAAESPEPSEDAALQRCVRELSDARSERARLSDELEKREKELFEFIQTLTKALNTEQLTPDMLKAQQLVEEGQYEKASQLLSDANLDAEDKCKRAKKMAHLEIELAIAKENRVYSEQIRSLVMEAECWQQTTYTEQRQQRIYKAYERASNLALEYSTRQEALYEFVEWLHDQNHHAEAHQWMEKFMATEVFATAEDAKKAEYCNAMGVILNDMHQPEAEGYLTQALTLIRALAKQNPDAYNYELATSCNNLGYFYDDIDKPKEAEPLYKEALALYRALAEQNPDAYNPVLATSCNNLGMLYAENDKPKEAEPLFKEALALRRALAEQNPDAYNPDLAESCNNLGLFYAEYAENDKPKEAEPLFKEALALRRALAEKNPDAHLPDLAQTCNNLGSFYGDNGKPKEAEPHLDEALALSRALAEKYPDAYNPVLAHSCYYLGKFYFENGKAKEAEPLYKEALALFRALAEKNPDAYNYELATSCNNLGVFYNDNDKPEKAEPLLQEAIALYRALAEKNPDAYNPDLAESCNNLGHFYAEYAENDKPKEAELLYKEALALYRALAEKNPDAYTTYLAHTYFNFGCLYLDTGGKAALKKAEPLLKEAHTICSRLAQKNEERHLQLLIGTENALCHFYKKSKNPSKAAQYAKLALAHQQMLEQASSATAHFLKTNLH